MRELAQTARTFMFTDVEGSTARWEETLHGMAAALEWHDTILHAAVKDHGGCVFKTVGDAFCAVFDDGANALAAALHVQRALASTDWSEIGQGFEPLRVRIGLHTGDADERDGDFFGPSLNRAARLTAAGHGGQILLSAAAHEELGGHLPDGVRLRDMGEHRLRDLRYSEHIRQVVADDQPDVTRPLETVQSLRRGDRIVVLDPHHRDCSVGGSEPLDTARSPVETLQSLRAAMIGDVQSVAVTPQQLREAGRHKPRDISEYRLTRIAQWSRPQYRLDGRFVALSLLLDQGVDALGDRWMRSEERYDDLGSLLTEVTEPALVVLGPPGCGKSTLLRHLEMELSISGLLDAGGSDTTTFYVPLSEYGSERPGEPASSPGAWLERRWSTRFPDMGPLAEHVAIGRVVFLLDALNEMPESSEQELFQAIQRWKRWLQATSQDHPGNRFVFSCRTLDYSATLSTPTLLVPQVRIEPLTDEQVKGFLQVYSPARWREVWLHASDSDGLDVLRSPYFLSLLVQQVEATGEIPRGRAALFTGFVRHALRREVERGNALFSPGLVLHRRDLRRIVSWSWRSPFDLPSQGALVPELGHLASSMQQESAQGERSQVRASLDEALAVIGREHGEDILAAGQALAVLDEDEAAGILMFVHQLVQEYFAARVLADRLDPEQVKAEWRARYVTPNVDELSDLLAPGEALPPLPQSGWAETAILAAAMTDKPDEFVRRVLEQNVQLAGQMAAQSDVACRLPDELVDEIKLSLIRRSRDSTADLRMRISCGLIAGELGDPRFQRCSGENADYLLPPLRTIPGGLHSIGDDSPITWTAPQTGESHTFTDHMPRHDVAVETFRIGRFPVTNAEFACFIAADGYDDPRWWRTADSRRWQRGELPDEGAKHNNRVWRRRFTEDTTLLEQMVDNGAFPTEEMVDRWRRWMQMDDDEFETVIEQHWQPQRRTQPAFWSDGRYNCPGLPVVGVCWFEASAYCAWLSSQAGTAFRLPTEVEREVAARGHSSRRFTWGDNFDRRYANTFETHVRRTTPVGVFPEGDSPEGVSDLAGNVVEWTSSLWGELSDGPSARKYGYPYDTRDGRESQDAPPSVLRVSRGGSWADHCTNSLSACRGCDFADSTSANAGFRVVQQSELNT